ncbi:trypsin-like peptidase domain-containing protein [Brevibacterium sp. FAM 24630]|uniref:S1C family serine protease n=1 Tax=Brevibacterium sp. FAM 24630 TaxID=3415680 RepID=UPI003C7ADBE2
MSDNSNPQNPDEGSTEGRRGPSAGGHRGSSAEVPRTFPNASQSSGPARVSPPVTPPERRSDYAPTQAQNPVDDASRRGGSSSQPPAGPQYGPTHQQGSAQQQNSPYPQQSMPYGQDERRPATGHQPGTQQPGYPQPGTQQPGYPQPGTQQPGYPQSGTYQQASSPQPSSPQPNYQEQGGGQPHPHSPQYGGAQYGDAQYGGSQHGGVPQPDEPGATQTNHVYAAPGTLQTGVGSQPMNPSGQPGFYGGPGGSGPYGPEQPPRREKRGPGWGATIAIAAIAALLGGALAFGGNYALSALQGEEPRKVAEETIETPDWTQVAEKTSDSVMSIQVGTRGQVQGLGSGALYDEQGHVITNNHVVAPADTPDGEIAVTMKNGETTEAKIVGRDPSTDIAVIKLEQVPDSVKPLVIGDSKKLSVGDPVMALGNPLGLADTVTTGIVSALDRPVSTENIGEDATSQEKELTITNAIQTDAAINPGNSGGPLVNGDGEFIGVNSAAASLSQAGEGQQSGSIGIGFAIPANQSVMIADQLIANGKALHPFLGITLTDGHINSGGITRGSAKVQSVQGGSPAAKAGIKDGDDIVEVAGTKANNAIALRALVRAQPVNSPVEVTVVRGGQEQKLDVTLVLK